MNYIGWICLKEFKVWNRINYFLIHTIQKSVWLTFQQKQVITDHKEARRYFSSSASVSITSQKVWFRRVLTNCRFHPLPSTRIPSIGCLNISRVPTLVRCQASNGTAPVILSNIGLVQPVRTDPAAGTAPKYSTRCLCIEFQSWVKVFGSKWPTGRQLMGNSSTGTLEPILQCRDPNTFVKRWQAADHLAREECGWQE